MDGFFFIVRFRCYYYCLVFSVIFGEILVFFMVRFLGFWRVVLGRGFVYLVVIRVMFFNYYLVRGLGGDVRLSLG